jgi:hypothetical protein
MTLQYINVSFRTKLPITMEKMIHFYIKINNFHSLKIYHWRGGRIKEKVEE